MNDLFDLGETLRAARERRGLSQVEVAEATRIKVHIIDAIEKNDFSRISVPLYGKGFVKLYAEHVGLDPAPLVRKYLEGHARSVQPSLQAQPPAGASGAPLPARRPASTLSPPRFQNLHIQDIVLDISSAFRQGREQVFAWVLRFSRNIAGARRGFAYARTRRTVLFPDGWRPYLVAGIGIVAVLGMLVFGIARLLRSASAEAGTPSGRPLLRLAEEPPAPYLKTKAP